MRALAHREITMAQPGIPETLSDRRWVVLSVLAVAQLTPRDADRNALIISEFRANHARTTKSNTYVKFSARAIDHRRIRGNSR
jgi:hypothetical protein